MKNFRLAWRNLWRNRRRTMITTASVFFAVFFALMFRSLQLGTYDHLFKNAIESYSGYLQVQQDEWWEDKNVDNTFTYTSEMGEQILSDGNVEVLIPRFESFALASNGPKTKGIMVMGIDPEKENYLSKIFEKKVKYRLTEQAINSIKADQRIPEKVGTLASKHVNESYTSDNRLLTDLGLDPKKSLEILPLLAGYARYSNGDIHLGEPGLWIGDKLSRYLELSIGDTLVLIGQGYHGTTAAGKYEIKGIVKLPVPDIDNKVVYLPYDIAQGLFNAEDQLTSLVLNLSDKSDQAIEETAERLRSQLADQVRIIDWKVMNEILISQMDADNKSGMIMIAILYLVIAFGVFGTILMMTAERRREFGVLVAIGMQKRKLASVISCEMLYIGLLGLLAGAFVGSLVISYGVQHPLVFKGDFALMFEDYGMEPVMKFQPMDSYFLSQSIIVGVMVGVSLIYPVRKVLELKVVNALRA